MGTVTRTLLTLKATRFGPLLPITNLLTFSLLSMVCSVWEICHLIGSLNWPLYKIKYQTRGVGDYPLCGQPYCNRKKGKKRNLLQMDLMLDVLVVSVTVKLDLICDIPKKNNKVIGIRLFKKGFLPVVL
jgi:hypothetical protein